MRPKLLFYPFQPPPTLFQLFPPILPPANFNLFWRIKITNACLLYTANIHPRFSSTFSSCGWFKEFNLKETHSLQLFITSAYWFSVLNYFSQAFRYECTIYCSFIESFILKLKFGFVTTWFTLYTMHIFHSVWN